MKTLTRNAARCEACGDVIESNGTGARAQCQCGRVGVEGGVTDPHLYHDQVPGPGYVDLRSWE